jgi:hypothetical protein
MHPSMFNNIPEFNERGCIKGAVLTIGALFLLGILIGGGITYLFMR